MGSAEGIATPIVAQIQKEIFDVQSIYLGKGFIYEIIEFLGMLIIDKAPDGKNGYPSAEIFAFKALRISGIGLPLIERISIPSGIPSTFL